MNNILIELKQVDIAYGDHVVLSDVDFRVSQDDFIGIIGPNGSGKTSLIKLILGEIEPFTGSIEMVDNLSIGYLPQINHLDTKFPITVEEMVEAGLLGLNHNGINERKAKKEQLENVLRQFRLEDIRNKQVGMLSGGQLQKTLLARSVVSSPQLLILDEPDTYIDNEFEHEMYEYLKKFNNDMGILLVSHDLGMISSYVKSIACVNRTLHHHLSNEISEEQLKTYNCPIDLITHGNIPHRVLKNHS